MGCDEPVIAVLLLNSTNARKARCSCHGKASESATASCAMRQPGHAVHGLGAVATPLDKPFFGLISANSLLKKLKLVFLTDGNVFSLLPVVQCNYIRRTPLLKEPVS
jgi:hypothetical protein